MPPGQGGSKCPFGHANLLNAGAFLRIKLTSAGKKITLEFDPTVEFPKALKVATTKLVEWAPDEAKRKLKAYADSDDITPAASRYLDDLVGADIGGG